MKKITASLILHMWCRGCERATYHEVQCRDGLFYCHQCGTASESYKFDFDNATVPKHQKEQLKKALGSEEV